MNLSKGLVIAGIILIGLGLIVWLFAKTGIPLGKLPGDIYYKSGRVQIYFPIVTCIIVTLFLSLLFWLFKK
jgi:hypothetical protein